MSVEIRITNQDLFDKMCFEYPSTDNLHYLKHANGFDGTISFQITEEAQEAYGYECTSMVSNGELSSLDFEDEFGFILEWVEEKPKDIATPIGLKITVTLSIYEQNLLESILKLDLDEAFAALKIWYDKTSVQKLIGFTRKQLTLIFCFLEKKYHIHISPTMVGLLADLWNDELNKNERYSRILFTLRRLANENEGE